ncbi:hypothetical protein [Aminobacter sp. MET-1]|uniref:hypothetical protein n=1 Tax=Aminobacter sp. MET-1 TaxID=2951085 RepID=UPI002269C6E3|nr:hypothetical protein [Aminobacter sp. MET-1]MCX8570775.1 hypothetical protein [Aminobacter sp. MET-1]
MNVANLQLEGLVMAVAALNQILVRKGVLSQEEVELALRKVESGQTSEERSESLSPANRDAINFPIRLLQLASRHTHGEMPPFSVLARAVGQQKEAYNDQM